MLWKIELTSYTLLQLLVTEIVIEFCLARCDFFVEKNTGRVLINEINTFPGFTAISMYPKLMEHEGLPVPQLIDRLIALAVERTEKQHG